ncbi:MAG: hypothetical protein GY729_19435 [Desulfobacteraceae bacterium]|nr:hypothetical protein [Desulfobacteraceae bacterium]
MIHKHVSEGKISLMESSFDLVQLCLEHSDDKSPMIVIGFSPPFYPHVANRNIPDLDKKISTLGQAIDQFSQDKFQMPYLSRHFYTGISDLSYAMLFDKGDFQSTADNMPLWGKTYEIPFETIKKIQMPCINIGPWGKDFHKISERVLMEDVYERTPQILDFTIRHILKKHVDAPA